MPERPYLKAVSRSVVPMSWTHALLKVLLPLLFDLVYQPKFLRSDVGHKPAVLTLSFS